VSNDNGRRRPKSRDAAQQAHTNWLLAIIGALVTLLAIMLAERYL